MRPQIPEQLEQQVAEVAELGGYASNAELVRDAVRRRVDELQKYPSDQRIRQWLVHEKQIEVLSENTFPAIKFDEETGEMNTLEDATWAILLRVFNFPVWVHGGLESAGIRIACTFLNRHVSDYDKQILLEAPGYLQGVTSDRRPTDGVFGADGIQVKKQFSRHQLTRAELVNTVFGIAGTVNAAVEDPVPYNQIVTDWDER